MNIFTVLIYVLGGIVTAFILVPSLLYFCSKAIVIGWRSGEEVFNPERENHDTKN